MVKIYWACYQSLHTGVNWQKFLDLLPEKMKQEVATYKHASDQHSTLFGKLLLKEAISNLGFSLNDIQYKAGGKPYIESGPDFNISHSGNYIVCAITSQGRLGIDIERKKKLDYLKFKKIFSEAEITFLEIQEDLENAFFGLWTKKEAVLKAEETGIRIPLKEIEVHKNICNTSLHQWHLIEIPLAEGYICSLATEKDLPYELIEISLNTF